MRIARKVVTVCFKKSYKTRAQYYSDNYICAMVNVSKKHIEGQLFSLNIKYI